MLRWVLRVFLPLRNECTALTQLDKLFLWFCGCCSNCLHTIKSHITFLAIKYPLKIQIQYDSWCYLHTPPDTTVLHTLLSPDIVLWMPSAQPAWRNQITFWPSWLSFCNESLIIYTRFNTGISLWLTHSFYIYILLSFYLCCVLQYILQTISYDLCLCCTIHPMVGVCSTIYSMFCVCYIIYLRFCVFCPIYPIFCVCTKNSSFWSYECK